MLQFEVAGLERDLADMRPHHQLYSVKLCMMPMSNEGYVLRSDLTLRSEFPYLTTRVFEVSPHRYVIAFDRTVLDANAIAERFAQSMRIITANVSLSNEVPSSYIRELAPITDQGLACDFHGLPFTKFDMFNILAARFPTFELADIEEPRDGVVRLVARVDPGADLHAAVQAFLDGLGTGKTVIIVDTERPVAVPSRGHGVDLHVTAAKLRPSAPSFVRQDENFWFENINHIYSGAFTHISVPGSSDLGTACFIDFSYGGQQLNLRQALLYYDTILVTPPMAETRDSWVQQRLSDEDCLRLVESGRLKFVLSQPEERGDTRLLEAAYERDPLALIGRRTAAAVVLRDLVQTAREYRLNDASLLPGVVELSRILAEELQWQHEDFIAFMLWPISALRRSLVPLMDSGALGISAFGQDGLLAQHYERASGKDLRLEMTAPGFQAHLAHAFNATVIPYIGQPESWIWIYRTIGDRLNFYRSFNTRIAASWAGNERRKEEKRAVLPPLPLFEFEFDTPISELIEVTALGSLRRKGRALLTRLSDLPLAERESEVARLAAEVRRLKGRDSGLFSLESLEDAGPITELALGTAVPPFFAMRNLLRRITSVGRRTPAIDRVVDAVEQEINGLARGNEDLDFLSKVDRVASLKRERIS